MRNEKDRKAGVWFRGSQRAAPSDRRERKEKGRETFRDSKSSRHRKQRGQKACDHILQFCVDAMEKSRNHRDMYNKLIVFRFESCSIAKQFSKEPLSLFFLFSSHLFFFFSFRVGSGSPFCQTVSSPLHSTPFQHQNLFRTFHSRLSSKLGQIKIQRIYSYHKFLNHSLTLKWYNVSSSNIFLEIFFRMRFVFREFRFYRKIRSRVTNVSNRQRILCVFITKIIVRSLEFVVIINENATC